MHLTKGAGNLLQAAKADCATQIALAGNKVGKHHRDLAIADRQCAKALGVVHQPPPVLAQSLQSRGMPLQLGRFAVIQRHALGIFTHAHQVETKVGLELLLPEVQADQRPADPPGEAAADQCVQQGAP